MSPTETPMAHADTPTRAREERFLVELLQGKSIPDAAAAVGVSRRTGYRIAARESFQAKYRAAKAELLTAATAALHSHSLSFIQTLAEVAKDTKLPGSYRVAASREGLSAMFRAVEVLDLAERIAKLEAVAGRG